MSKGGQRSGAGRRAGEPTTTVSVRVPVSVLAEWKALAKALKMPVSKLVRESIAAQLALRRR